jgi:hypothetical protein
LAADKKGAFLNVFVALFVIPASKDTGSVHYDFNTAVQTSKSVGVLLDKLAALDLRVLDAATQPKPHLSRSSIIIISG